MKNNHGNANNTFGAILIDAQNNVLLRQPTNQFGGYAWTFAKGHPKQGEATSQTALRVLLEKTGWHAEILGEIPELFPGTTSVTKFFLAGRVAKVGEPDTYTAETRWADFAAASALIRESPNPTGQERDLAVLRAAERELEHLPWRSRPATCPDDWNIQPLPERHIEILAGYEYDDAEMALIRKGFLPQDMDEKWFAWFGDGVLHLHRSWTGLCIFQVRFERSADGWSATTALLNRDPREYGETDEDNDHALIHGLIEATLLRDTFQHCGPFGGQS